MLKPEKPFKIVAFDIDGTLTKGQIWERTNTFFGVTQEEDARLYNKYEAGEISYAQWIDELAKIYRKATKTQQDVLTSLTDFEFEAGAVKTVDELKKRYAIVLVTGGFDFYAERVAKALGIDEIHANAAIIYNPDGTFKEFRYKGPEVDAKVTALQEIMKKHGAGAEEIVFVGDSSNDLNAFVLTQHGILIGRGSEKLRKAAWRCVDSLNELAAIIQ